MMSMIDKAPRLARNFQRVWCLSAFGGNTTKPDVHIIRFVSDAIGRKVTDVEALRLLEAVAAKFSIILHNLDTSIWEKMARSLSST